MKRNQMHRSLVTGAFVLAAMGIPSVASAQTTEGGWALNRFDPTPTGDYFFYAEHPWYSSTRVFAVGLEADYSSNPLVLESHFANGSTTRTAVVSSMLMGHIGAQVSFLDRIGIGLSLPISFSQDGTTVTNGATSLGPAAGLAVGDLRANARVRIFGQSDVDPFSLHVSGSVWIPIGQRADNTGDGSVRVEPRLVMAGRASVIRWSLSGGFMLRTDLGFANVDVGNELRFNAALGFVADQGRLTIGPEAYVVSAAGSLPNTGNSALFQDAQWGAEIIGGVHYLIADKILVGAGAGPGLQRGYGVPAFRALFSLAYAPVTRRPDAATPIDTDLDGVFDPDDLCPTVPQGEHPDPARRGCPAQDTDGDGVLDPDDQCVTVPQGDHPDPARRGCPLNDTDGDGVLDPDDLCVDVPQGPSPDPDRRGCPDGDRDRDTVFDHQDQCVDVPQGPYPDPTRLGCPLADRDGDTVPDNTDHCPDVPGAPSTDPNRNGCPSEVRMETGRITLLLPVFFDTDRDTIRRESFRVVDRVADVLASATYIRRVSIDGHTDDRGSMEHNMDLSQRRVNSVMRYLTEHRIAADRLEAHGYGPTRPITPNVDSRSRARNRRVEFLILDPAPAGGTTQVQVNVPVAPGVPTGEPGHGHHGHHGRHGH